MTTTTKAPSARDIISAPKAPPPCDFPREADPGLYDFYAEGLLEPGWAGEVDDVEAAYIAWHLTNNAAVRRTWRVRDALGYRAKRVTPGIARRLCEWWAGEVLKTPCVDESAEDLAMDDLLDDPDPMSESHEDDWDAES